MARSNRRSSTPTVSKKAHPGGVAKSTPESQQQNSPRVAAKKLVQAAAASSRRTSLANQEEEQDQPMEETHVKSTPASATSSVPSSPQQKPMVDASAATDAAASTSNLPSPVVVSYTAGEQKMVDTITSVSQKIQQLACSLPTLSGQIANHAARIALFKWHPKHLTFDAEKLHRAHKTLHYNAGMVDENVLQQIFRLDSIQTENDHIRHQRKAAVKQGNEVIKASVALRERMDKLKRLLPKWEPTREVPMEDVPTPTATTTDADKKKQQQQEEETKMQESESSDEEEEVEAKPQPAPQRPQQKQPVQPQQRASPPRPATASAAAPAPAPAPAAVTALDKKYAHLRLPTYAGPRFQASVHPQTGSLVIEADLEGIEPEDITIVPEDAKRIITVRGVRLPQRRAPATQSFGGFFGAPQPRAVAPYGHFTKVISMDEVDPQKALDMKALQAKIDARSGILQLIVPRGAVRAQPRAAPQQPQQQRRPVQHSTWFEPEEEEEEESHPYARQQPARAQPQQQYRRQTNPFFSGFY